MNFIYLNKRIVKALNSLKVLEFGNIIAEILEKESDERIRKIFTSKIYIWNLIRSKDIYKLTAMFISNRASVYGVDDKLALLIDVILETANNDVTRKRFCEAINDRYTILTNSICKYIGEDTLRNILSKENYSDIISDKTVAVFINRLVELEKMMDSQLNIYNL